MKGRQSGVTLVGFILILAVVGFFAYAAMKLVPAYTEFMGVQKAMTQIGNDGTAGKTLDDIRRDLMFKMNFQYVDDATIKPKDITVQRQGNAATLHVQYDKIIPFMYNVSLLLHFETSKPLAGDVTQ